MTTDPHKLAETTTLSSAAPDWLAPLPALRPLPIADAHGVCGSCGLRHRRVEAGGIWFCPNPLCTSAGADYWRKPATDDEGTDIAKWVALYPGPHEDEAIEQARRSQEEMLRAKYLGAAS